MSKLTGNQEFNGEVYVKGVGGYNGTNPVSGSNDLATAINDVYVLPIASWTSVTDNKDQYSYSAPHTSTEVNGIIAAIYSGTSPYKHVELYIDEDHAPWCLRFFNCVPGRYKCDINDGPIIGDSYYLSLVFGGGSGATYKSYYAKIDLTNQTLELTGQEDVSNKVTALSSSSTNIQYPSAKSVVDYINGDPLTYILPIQDSSIAKASDTSMTYSYKPGVTVESVNQTIVDIINGDSPYKRIGVNINFPNITVAGVKRMLRGIVSINTSAASPITSVNSVYLKIDGGNYSNINALIQFVIWPYGNTIHVIQGEHIDRMVTSLSSSSTDLQYPSAKCVYDEIQNSLGNIETILQSI